jgi:hypothetical protein
MLSSLLLEEIAAIICSRRSIDFFLCIYTNLMNICINNFNFLKNIRQHFPYTGNYLEFSILQIYKIYTTKQLILFYFYQ